MKTEAGPKFYSPPLELVEYVTHEWHRQAVDRVWPHAPLRHGFAFTCPHDREPVYPERVRVEVRLTAKSPPTKAWFLVGHCAKCERFYWELHRPVEELEALAAKAAKG